MKITEAKILLDNIDNLARHTHGLEDLYIENLKTDLENFTGHSIEEIRNASPSLMEEDCIEIPVSSGKKLVAEKCMDPDYKEIYVFLRDANGVITQDLAQISERYEYIENGDVENEVKPLPGRYKVNVYADSYSEDYTDTFNIDEYKEDEDA